MNISIENYGINLSCYEYETITLGYEFKHAKKLLSDNNFDTFLADTITHEFLHGLLLKEFDITTCKLFDTVEHFICDANIKETLFKYMRNIDNDDFPITWKQSIITEGFNEFLAYYHIDKQDIIQAYIIAGGK